MKILLVSDAWEPQTNGVVTTMKHLVAQLTARGHQVNVFDSSCCANKFALPFYPEIVLGLPSKQEICAYLDNGYDIIHIVTLESMLGNRFAKICQSRNIPYTSSYHTNFPEYINRRTGISKKLLYGFWRSRYNRTHGTLTASNSCTEKLRKNGYHNVTTWSRGVDRNIFNYKPKQMGKTSRRLVCVSRISDEKNLPVFFEMYQYLDDNDRLIMVGDGPLLNKFKNKYPWVEFTGKLTGKKLANQYRAADVFVFPSVTDTFGLVMIEANACGVPVLAFNVEGPKDIVKNHINGYLCEHNANHSIVAQSARLVSGLDHAIKCNVDEILQENQKWTWENCCDEFLRNSKIINWKN